MIGKWDQILLAVPTALIGMYALARGVQLTTAHPVERLLMLGAALLLITPGIYTDILGGVLIILGFLAHRFFPKKEKAGALEGSSIKI